MPNHQRAILALCVAIASACGSGGTDSRIPASPSDAFLGAGSGLTAQYFDNADLTNLKVTRVDPGVDFEWGEGSPAQVIAPDAFSARWAGQVLAPVTGVYSFSTISDDGVRLWVNGEKVIDNWSDHAATTDSGQISLVAGQRYDIKLEYFENGGLATIQLSWMVPGQSMERIPPAWLFPVGDAESPARGLSAQYFDNPDLTKLKVTRVDPVVSFDWADGSPAPEVAPDTFSARWTGQVLAPLTGAYVFSTSSDDGVRLWVNGEKLIDNWTDHAAKTDAGQISLVAGQRYDLKLEYYENAGLAAMNLSWTVPGQSSETIPAASLSPVVDAALPGSGLTAEYFDNADLTGLRVTRVDPGVSFAWMEGSPAPEIAPDTFSARWTGQVLAPATGTYTFSTTSDDGVRLWVNGQRLIDHWTDHAEAADSGQISLVAGQHYDLKLEYYENSGLAAMSLSWTVPGQNSETIPAASLSPVLDKARPGTGLTAEYFDNADLTGVKVTRLDPGVSFAWLDGSPAPEIAPDTFSARWTGQVLAPADGTYTFSTTSDDGVRLWVNGQKLIDHWTDHAEAADSGQISLVAGQRYDLKLEYYENAGLATTSLSWIVPGKGAETIPAAQLYPSSSACVASCAGRTCGNDGCGGSCGGCAAGESCGASGQCDATTPTSPPASAPPPGVVPAFAGAQGGGAATRGGRGGAVYRVTNLNDSGAGSLRACVEASGPRTCVFTVGGTIHLSREYHVTNPYLTVAGQTAPGDGIAVYYGMHGGSQHIFSIGPPAHDVIIRFVRMWGDWVNCVSPGGSYVGTGGVTVWGGVYNVIVDHCEMLWHSGAAFGVWADRGTAADNGRVTVSWSLMGEPIVNSTCTIAGLSANPQSTVMLTADQKYNPSTLQDVDVHHNLFANGDHRMPEVNGRSRVVNNVIYNYQRALDIESGGNPGGAASMIDVIGNVFWLGPWRYAPTNREIQANWGSASVYTANNISDWHTATGSESDGGWSALTDYSNTYQGKEAGRPAPSSYKRSPWARLPPPSSGIDISVDPASTLVQKLSAAGGVGASMRLTCDGGWTTVSNSARDRILRNVATRTGPSESAATAAQSNGGALPAIASGTPCPDANANGIPDGYEMARCGSAACLNASAVQSDGFTNLEHYLNGMK